MVESALYIALVTFLLGFFLGVIITISEPDLQVLAAQVPSVPNMVLILSVAAGVGAFLVVALLRILFGIALAPLLVVFYGVIFVIARFVPDNFLAVAFDSGGVTTGPMTVPFIMALGVGISAIRNDKHAENDSFGLVALCSIGPVLAVLLLGLVYPAQGSYVAADVPEAFNSVELGRLFLSEIPYYLKEIAGSMLPIVFFFGIFQLVSIQLHKKTLIKICVGLLYTYVGLVLFLTGANVGFIPAGNYLGTVMASLPCPWILVPVGMVIGYFDTVVTYGSSSSNHCRVISNMATVRNIPCYIISPEEASEPTYNSKMMQLFGAEITTVPVDEVSRTIDEKLAELRECGRKPYFIPGGGHGNLGTQAYVDCYNEICAYEKENELHFDYIFFASGTGTTQAGLVCGQIMHGDEREIVGVSIARKNPRGRQVVLDSVKEYLCGDVADELIESATIFIDDYIGDGYGKQNEAIKTTIKNMLSNHGIPMDSTYTAKAYTGMMDYIEKQEIKNKNILFIHTGGTPLFFDDFGRL